MLVFSSWAASCNPSACHLPVYLTFLRTQGCGGAVTELQVKHRAPEQGWMYPPDASCSVHACVCVCVCVCVFAC